MNFPLNASILPHFHLQNHSFGLNDVWQNNKLTNEIKTAHVKHKLQAKMTIRNLQHLMLKKSYLDFTFLTVLAYNYSNAHFVNLI
jgi:hypothetical protein